MNGRTIRSGPTKPNSVMIVILTLMLVSSMLPLAVNAGSKTTKLSDGSTEVFVEFPPGGGTETVSLTLPYGAMMSKASIGLEGLPSSSDGMFNHSTIADFIQGTANNVVITDENIVLATRDKWWNSSFHYRFEVEFNSSIKDRDDIIVAIQANMTKMLLDFGVNREFDKDSIRVVEHTVDGSFVVFNASLQTSDKYLVRHRYTTSPDYQALTNANLTIEWNVTGHTPKNTTRYYSVYFDIIDYWKLPAKWTLDLYDDVIFTNREPQIGDSYVYLSNNGSGPDTLVDFQLPSKIPYKPEVADINRDGYLDIVIPNFGNTPNQNDITSYIYLGSSQGYQNTPDIQVPTKGARAAKVADFNSDGFMDIIFACMVNNSNFRTDSVLYLGGPTGFKSVPDYKFNTTGASDVEVLDFNGDGRLDVAFSSYFDGAKYNTTSKLWLMPVGGQMFGYEANKTFPTYGSHDVTSGDINQDGIDDIFFANYKDDLDNYDINSVYYLGRASGVPDGPHPIKGHGAFGLAVVDVNADTLLDIVVANAGPPGLTKSSIFYYNDTGDYLVPTLMVTTNNASGIAYGDVNDDEQVDLVFSQYMDQTGTDIDSKLFIWCCSGYVETNRVLLPTRGAAGVILADVDTYHMDLDQDPPILTIKGMEDIYFESGNLTSKALRTQDNVMSAVATWTSTQPLTSTVRVFLSNNGGANWTETQNTNGIIFDTVGDQFMYRIELGTKIATPTFMWLNVTYTMGSYPTNLEVDIGSDGESELVMEGLFNYSYIWNSSALPAALDMHTSPDRFYPWENITVQIALSSNSSGIVHVHSIDLAHNSAPYVKKPLPDITFDENGVAFDALRLYDHFGDLDNDSLAFTSVGNKSVFVKINPGGLVDIRVRPDWSGHENISILATDGTASVSDTMMVTIRRINDPPVAAITRSPKGGVSTLMNVTFDGYNSTDTDGKINQYIWDFGDGASASGPIVSHAYSWPSKGYKVVLKVIDDGGLSDTAEIYVPVDPLSPIAQLKIVGETNTGFNTYTNILIDMSGTKDPDGEIVNYTLDFGDGGVLRPTSPGGPPAVWEHQYKDDGTFTITLRVTDSWNLKSEASVKVIIKNVGPVISNVVAPGTSYVGQKVTFGVSATDRDGAIAQYMWDFEGKGEFSWNSTSAGNATHTYKKAGNYRATLKIVDNDGAATYQTVSIKVTEPAGDSGLGLALVLFIVLLAAVSLMVYYIFHQRSLIYRQRDLLVKRDETLRALQRELSGEEPEEEPAPKAAPPAATTKAAPVEEEDEEAEEEDLGTLEPLEAETPKQQPPKPSPKVEDSSTIFKETTTPTIAPLETTGIMGETPPPPPPPSQTFVPKGLPDMMGAAQAPVVPVAPKERPAEETEEEEEEEGEPEEEEEAPEEEPEQEPEPEEPKKVLAKARCPGCKSLIPLYSLERPMRIKCQSCGKEGVIK